MDPSPSTLPDLDFERDPRVLVELGDTLELGVFTVGPDGLFVAWSRGAERITGLRRSEVEGRPCRSFDRPGSRALGVACRPEPSDGPVRIDGRILVRNGRELDVRGRARTLVDDQGQLVGVLGWFREIAGLVVPDPVAEAEVVDAGTPRLRELVGGGAAMAEAFRRIRLAARSDVTALVVGESGTGKELAARAIHQLGERSGGPFVAVNCSALPESLLESELFGHVQGAFTGAVRDRAGVLEEAHRGTLFLDEIGDISPLMQVKLLRALQERTIRRVGGDREIPIDVRLLAATNKDLKQLVADGAMREDFYYRVRVYEVAMPPLRERLEDVPALVDHFIARLNERMGRTIRGISREALQRLLDHHWPGNVRELRNAIEHAFVTVETEVIEPYDLPEDVRSERLPHDPDRPTGGLDSREVADREHVLDALNACAWNRTETAKLLGVSRVTLWKKMRKYRIDEGIFRRGG